MPYVLANICRHYYHNYIMCGNLEQNKSYSLPPFHAFTDAAVHLSSLARQRSQHGKPGTLFFQKSSYTVQNSFDAENLQSSHFKILDILLTCYMKKTSS